MLVKIGQIDGFNTIVNSLISSFVVGSYLPLTGGTLTGNLTAPTFIGALQGNATTATRLQTARTIALSGAATGTATSFNGSANISISVTGLNASNLNTGTVPTARLGSGTASSSTVLYGNNTWGTIPVAVDTITRLRGTTSGTLVSGDITLLAGSNTTITQSGNSITIASANTNTTYAAGTGITLSGTTFSHTAHTGDVTGSTALTIANNVVTFAKMQNIATQRLLGRGTAGSGNIEELTLGSGLALSTTGVLSATGSGGTVTSIAAGNGMNFTTISGTGTVTLGTPSAISLTSTNSTTSTSHTHALDSATTTAINNGNTAFGWGNHSGLYALVGRSIVAGNGLSGGGTLAANRTITLGTPSPIGLSTTNSVTTTSHTHALDATTITAINQGVTAHGWGNHASENYAKTATDVGLGNVDNYSRADYDARYWDWSNELNGSCASGWVTIANFTTARGQCEFYVWDNESSDHAYIHIQAMRSYNSSSATVTLTSGHQTRIQGVRFLKSSADTTYGNRKLQIRVTATSIYRMKYKIAKLDGYSTVTPVAPVLEDIPSGFVVDSVVDGFTDSAGGTGNTGYVRAGKGMTINGNQVWHSGNLLQSSINDWNTAYGWGNHSGLYALVGRSIVAGNGLSGGGTLAANRTITLGTPGDITLSSTSSVSTSSHTHAFTPGGTTAQYIRGDGSLATYVNTTYTAGTGLSLSGTTFGQAITTSGTGTYVQSITQTTSGFQVNLGTPPNTNTTYSNMAIAELNTGTVTSGRVISASVLNQWLNAKGFSTQTLTAGTNITISGSTISATNTNTTYSAGTGLTLTGTVFSLPVNISGSGNYVADVSASATGLSVTKGTLPVSSLVTATTAAGVSNVATTNTNTFLNIVEGGASVGSSTQITGTGSVTVTSDSTGKLTINGVNTNTTYSGSTSIILSGTSFQRAALTGDVTAAQNSNATTIANSAVTHAKYQNIATQRILGRGATGTGNVQELTLGTGLTLSTAGVLSATNTSSGTVTSVGLTIAGNALNTNLATITSSGTFGLTWGGTTAQYVNGQGNLVTFPSIPSISNLVTTNTQQTVNAKKQWTTPQTNVPISNYREISNIGAWAGSSSHSSTTYYMFNLGDALPAVMWEAELVLIQYSSSTAVNTSPSRSLTIKVSGYNSSAGSSLVNKRVEVIEGDSSIIDNVTYFRDANNLLSVGIKLNTSAPYPKGYFKTIRLHHSVNDTRENSIVNNASVTALTDISSLTSVSVVSAANILKNIDSGNINSITTLVQTTRTITAGNGLTGGGTLAANRTITLGTPGDITLSSTSSVGTSSHTHAFNPGGTTSQYIRGDGSLATYANTTYTAGTGLSLSGTTFGQAITTSGTGTYVQSITQTTSGFQVNLGTPPNSNTTYSNMSIAELNTGTVTTGRSISASVLNQWLNAKGFSTQTLTAGTNITISGNTISATNTNTTYSAGTGLTLTGTVFSLPVNISGSGNYVADVSASATGLSVTKGTLPVSSLVTATTATGVSNVATTNTNTFLNIVEGNASVGSSTQITGTGSVTVTSDAAGKLTINGTNTNTTYSGSTSIILSGTSFQRAALTGDVTASQNSNATTIANSAVTHAKYQNIATQRILGRGATGTGNVQELTLGTGLSLSTAGVLSVTGSGSVSQATATVLGGVKLFSNTVQTVAATAVSATASRTYGIQLNSSGQAVVNVPWSNTTYTSGSLTVLNAGTNSTNRVWGASILSDWLNGKGYLKSIQINGTMVYTNGAGGNMRLFTNNNSGVFYADAVSGSTDIHFHMEDSRRYNFGDGPKNVDYIYEAHIGTPFSVPLMNGEKIYVAVYWNSNNMWHDPHSVPNDTLMDTYGVMTDEHIDKAVVPIRGNIVLPGMPPHPYLCVFYYFGNGYCEIEFIGFVKLEDICAQKLNGLEYGVIILATFRREYGSLFVDPKIF